MLEQLDSAIGRILATLDRLHLDGRTIVIFTSDNGGLATAEGHPTSNLPLRGGKGWPYEGGVREPLIVRWPGVTKAGSVCETPIISTDYYPTMLQMAGLPLRPEQHLDGVSLVRLLNGEKLAERTFFWHYPHYGNQGGSPAGAIRRGNYKLIEWYEDMRVELYNLKDDPGEHEDLSAKKADQTETLRLALHAWRDQVKAVMPTPNPNFKE
jgi:arylsulfatase A-like enzyme